MPKTKIAGIGFHVPERVVTNEELTHWMDTTNEWIIERTGIEERRYAKKFEETPATLAARASEIAIERAGISKEDIDFIIFATLSPDYYFPGVGVLLQRELGITHTACGALDIRNQCSGFVYGLSVADQFIQSGMYKNILLVGSEVHSFGLDYSTRGRNVSFIFGDGAGAVVLQPTEEKNRGVLTTKLHSDGTYAEKLCFISLGSHGGYHNKYQEEPIDYGFDPELDLGGLLFTQKMAEDGLLFPYMDGQFVFKFAVQKFPEVVQEMLQETQIPLSELNMFIPHQANLRITQFVQRRLQLRDDQVWSNIQKYGNTTAASIPIAMCEAWESGKIKDGDLVALAAFGSGFTWGGALIRW
jgi:3-oxoacyl-[acyl-carrier-protein] synthase-3